MDLKEKLIALGEKREVGTHITKELNEDKTEETMYYLKLSTKEGAEIGQIIKNEKEIIPRVLIKSLCDEKGDKLFDEADIEYINRLPIAFTSEIFKEMLEFNKILPKDENSTPEEETEKN